MDLKSAQNAILVKSEPLDPLTPIVQGYNFGNRENLIELNYEELFKSYFTTGFQATNLALVIQVIFSFHFFKL